jgi:hypothetical protein
MTVRASATSRPSDSAVMRSAVRTLLVPMPSSATVTRTAPSAKVSCERKSTSIRRSTQRIGSSPTSIRSNHGSRAVSK